MSAPAPHWENPWEPNVVPVPIEELAEIVAGGLITLSEGSTVPYTKDLVLRLWQTFSKGPLDAYVFREPTIMALCGVRYGAEGHEYLSPGGDIPALRALAAKYDTQVSQSSPSSR